MGEDLSLSSLGAEFESLWGHVEDAFNRDAERADAFMCRCSPEGVAQADAVMAETVNRLTTDMCKVDASNMLTAVVISLNWDYNASITTIANDQWSMVVATRYPHANDPYEVVVMCDNVEDGIAAVWLGFADKPV
jgi:hypothetical protein